MSAREVHELDNLVELGLFCSRSDAVRHCVSEYLIRARIEYRPIKSESGPTTLTH